MPLINGSKFFFFAGWARARFIINILTFELMSNTLTIIHTRIEHLIMVFCLSEKNRTWLLIIE